MSRMNIILDFMDPENRILYGSYKNLPPEEHVRQLKEGLNLAVFLCEDFCILPPCAFLQCSIARQALQESPCYFDEGLIKLPMRERSLESFLEKKRRNYAKDQTDSDYAEFFAEGGPAFLRQHAAGIVRRDTRIGDFVAATVEATPFSHPLWEKLKNRYPQSVLEQIQTAPRKLIEQDEAISVKAIKRLCGLEGGEDVDFQIGRILQNKYFYAYIYEYHAALIRDIPPKTTEFMIEDFGPAYEYSYWKNALKSLGLYDLILKSGSRVVSELRDIPSCSEFVDAMIAIGESSPSVNEAKRRFSRIAGEVHRLLGRARLKMIPAIPDGQDLPDDIADQIVEAFDAFLEVCSASEREALAPVGAPVKPIADHSAEERIEALKRQLTPCDMDKPFVFIGYNRADMEETVYQDCVMLGKMGVNYWIDSANMHGCDQHSQGWKSVANEALPRCRIYIPYVSPSFFDSEGCCEEVNDFFDQNQDAGILILLKNGYTENEIIQKILRYNNILQADTVRNMITLFKANNTRGAYFIDQLYSHCSSICFEHYLSNAMFYNTFRSCGMIDLERFPDYQTWRAGGEAIRKEVYL